MYRLYDLLLFAAALVLTPYALFKGIGTGHAWRGLGERLALYDSARLKMLKGRKVIWVHAVSVGETRASIPLLRALKKSWPDACIVLSSLTFTGRATADEIEEADLCVFLPYDLSWVVKRALKKIRPDVTLIVETEIWPNFVRRLSAEKIPVVLVNGRISDRSFPRYWLVRPLLKPLLGRFAHFCMQSRMDALRIIRLGAASGNVSVTGNIKFDLPDPGFETAEIDHYRASLRLPDEVPVWVAGSTRQGEEEIVLAACRKLIDSGTALLPIIVPRYPDRARAVCDQVVKAGFSCQLRSAVDSRDRDLQVGDVLVGDTLGEMLKFYACADVVFVGGSLVPVGGHNILEASLLRKPVLFGPHMQNFKVISQLLTENGGGVEVTEETLARTLEQLLADPDGRERMGEKGHALFAEHSGATRRTVETVRTITGWTE